MVVMEELSGLRAEQVAERIRLGLVNRADVRTSRTVREIVRANVVTRFNAILGALLLVVATVGPFQDALFGVVLVINTTIGVAQEVRAKRMLDRLALLSAVRCLVRRDGEMHEMPVEDLVDDDVLDLRAGDQVPVDAVVLTTSDLEVDESLLTGEADPVVKRAGEGILSGSVVVAGSGVVRATDVGERAYAQRLAAEARRFELVRSELKQGIDLILRVVTWLIVPTAIIVVSSQLRTDQDLVHAVRGSVAGIGSMVPEGLVLLTSMAFGAAVVRLGRRGVLVQELAAVEVLARVDVICIDKTGTLTEAEPAFAGIEPFGDIDGSTVEFTLGALAAADPQPNASLRAIGAACPDPGWTSTGTVPFSSGRRWSAASFSDNNGSWVLGAPDVLLEGSNGHANARKRAAEFAAAGRRVLLLGRALSTPEPSNAPRVEPVALVALEERIRADAAETVSFFRDQDVRVVVLSGDHPDTVASVAERAGIHGTGVDASELSDDETELAAALESASIFGRVEPHRKRKMVHALQSLGHVVAMIGDGVNDVLALKDADIGIAMGSGSPASRSVARLVLLDSSWSAMPAVVAEGRRVLANIERVANLFVTKTVYAMALALAVGAARLPFPFFPRHLTIVGSLTIGIPAFFLALAPNARRARPGFIGRVFRFAAPAGVVAAGATFSGYALAHNEHGVPLGEARTAATITLFLVALEVLFILSRPLTPSRAILLGAMPAIFVGVLVIPDLRSFFALELPPPIVLMAVIGVGAVANLLIEAGWRSARVAHRSFARHHR